MHVHNTKKAIVFSTIALLYIKSKQGYLIFLTYTNCFGVPDA